MQVTSVDEKQTHESKPVTCKKEMIAKGFDLHHHSNHYHRLERPRHRKNDKHSEVDGRSDSRCGRRWFLFGPHKSTHPHKSSVPLRSSQINGSSVGAEKVTGITPGDLRSPSYLSLCVADGFEGKRRGGFIHRGEVGLLWICFGSVFFPQDSETPVIYGRTLIILFFLE
ncbi:hypothetical protein LXL04_029413 [Taraxacum kok-saghyz]